MPGNSTRMLDLRLAERALKGEGRLSSSGRISSQIKREGYHRDKITRQIEKERRVLMDRINLQERKFLSEQMFRKDLNPFLVVFRSRHAGGECKVGDWDGKVSGEVEVSGIKKAMKCPCKGNFDEPMVEELDKSREKLPEAFRLPELKHDFNVTHLKSGSSKTTIGWGLENIQKLKLERNTTMLIPIPKLPETTKHQRYPKSLTYMKTNKEGLIPVLRAPENLEQQKRSKTVTFFNQDTGFRHSKLDVVFNRSGPSVLREMTKSSMEGTPTAGTLLPTTPTAMTPMEDTHITMTSPPGTSSASTPTPETGKPKVQIKTPRITLPKVPCVSSLSKSNPRTVRQPAMKTYTDVVTDICRALAPGEARMAERKRVEAEDAEGITERKSEILNRCRNEAEQDVFTDLRWKRLMNSLLVPRG